VVLWCLLNKIQYVQIELQNSIETFCKIIMLHSAAIPLIYLFLIYVYYYLSVPELRIICVKLTSIDTACVISSPNPMFNHLFESSRWDDSNTWSIIEFGEEIGSIEVKYAPYLVPWCPVFRGFAAQVTICMWPAREDYHSQGFYFTKKHHGMQFMSIDKYKIITFSTKQATHIALARGV